LNPLVKPLTAKMGAVTLYTGTVHALFC
jgi:hypothetical protein